MNVTRIQQDIIKDCLTGKAAKWWVQITEAEARVGTNQQIYLMGIKDFLLDTKALIVSGVRDLSVNVMLSGADNAKPATKTGITRQKGNYKCLELKVDEELIYIDESLLKYYDKSVEFDGTNGKSPVYVYEDDILVGMIMPVV